MTRQRWSVSLRFLTLLLILAAAAPVLLLNVQARGEQERLLNDASRTSRLTWPGFKGMSPAHRQGLSNSERVLEFRARKRSRESPRSRTAHRRQPDPALRPDPDHAAALALTLPDPHPGSHPGSNPSARIRHLLHRRPRRIRPPRQRRWPGLEGQLLETLSPIMLEGWGGDTLCMGTGNCPAHNTQPSSWPEQPGPTTVLRFRKPSCSSCTRAGSRQPH